jgi:hypothetical protein
MERRLPARCRAGRQLCRGIVPRMPKAAFVTVQLARFDHVRDAGPVDAKDRPGVLFAVVGADVRAAATEPASQRAYTFLVLGLHADAESAQQFVADRGAVAPWLDEAKQVWSGVLQPFRHKGEANFLDAATPGLLFDTLAEPAAADAPFVSITSVGWVLGPGLDMERVRQFGAGVSAIRMSMTAVDGLYSQQSFFFPGALVLDPVTVTFWRDDPSARAFSYGAGVHRHQMDRLRAENLADRTSFTRCHVRHSAGAWPGVPF